MNRNMIKQMAIIIGLLTLFIPATGFCEPVGKVTSVEGRVDVTRSGKPAESVESGTDLHVGDIIRTKSKSRASVQFADGSTLRIAQETRLEITEFLAGKKQTKGILNLFRGKIFSAVKKTGRLFGKARKNRFEVRTPTAVVGVRGTEFITYHQQDISGAVFKEGSGYCYSRNLPDAIRFIQAGQAMTVASAYRPPAIRPFSQV